VRAAIIDATSQWPTRCQSHCTRQRQWRCLTNAATPMSRTPGSPRRSWLRKCRPAHGCRRSATALGSLSVLVTTPDVLPGLTQRQAGQRRSIGAQAPGASEW
jgi:hypothetical protein